MFLCILLGGVGVAGVAVLLNHRRKDKQIDYDYQLKMSKSLEETLRD
jgi:hypothetical protein